MLLFGNKKEVVDDFHKESKLTLMKKCYYARVKGDFPWDEKILCTSIVCISHKDGVYRVGTEFDPETELTDEVT